MFDSVKIKNKKNCKIIAHRGLSGIERENTCPAFLLAGSKSYFGIETDVHVTKDGKFIICHDDNVFRVTGHDLVIEESNLHDLTKLSVFDSDEQTKRSDLFLPLPSDYFNIFKKYSKISVFELKNLMPKNKIKEICGQIIDMQMFDNTIFISFCKENLLAVKEFYSNAKIQYLTGDATAETLDFIKQNGFGLDIYFGSLTKEYVDLVHSLGLEVNCWTCDNLADAERLIEMGVDYITTNILE